MRYNGYARIANALWTSKKG